MISRCIGCMDEVLLLSEIHPHAKAQSMLGFSIITQAKKWHKLPLPAHLVEDMPFVEKVNIIQQCCIEQGKDLVLRDWAHVDFIGPPVTRSPAGIFSLNQLLKDQFDVVACALVRHPMDMWLSVSRMKIIAQNKIDYKKFLQAYKSYLIQLGKTPVIKFEEFTHKPGETMQRISDHLQIRFDSEFVHNWPRNRLLTGDMKHVSRAGGSTEIKVLQRRQVPTVMNQAMRQNPNYTWILQHLDYQHDAIYP